MEWDSGKSLLLIDLYEERKVLWDSKHPAYFNKLKKQDAWMTISEILAVDEEDVKKKMNSLLGSFRRERARQKKSITTGSGTNTYKSKWFAFEKMHFLLDKNEPTGTMDDTMLSIVEEDSLTGENTLNDSQLFEINERQTIQDVAEDGAGCNETAESFPVPRAPKRRKRQEDPRIDEAFSMLKQASVPMDSCTAFGHYIASKLRTYEPRIRSCVEHAINNVLFDADMGCCIFNKPKKFDDSSSEDSDDECDHCHGHVEKKKHKKGSNEAAAVVSSNPSENYTETETLPNPEPPSSD